MSQVHLCILCNKVPQPQKQAYFRNVTEESLLSLKELLNKHYGEQEVQRCLEEPVVLCKCAYQTPLKKLLQLKQDFKSLEKDVLERWLEDLNKWKSILKVLLHLRDRLT